MLSLARPPRWRHASRRPSTASTPADLAPHRRRGAGRASPPALVATMPPIVAESARAEVDADVPARGTRRRRAAARVTPAPTVTWPATTSTPSMPASRRRLSTTSPARGTDPPTRPVLPPWGTTATPARPQARQDRRHLVGRAGPHHRRPPVRAAGPVDLVGGGQFRVGEDMGGPDDLFRQLRGQVHGRDASGPRRSAAQRRSMRTGESFEPDSGGSLMLPAAWRRVR